MQYSSDCSNFTKVAAIAPTDNLPFIFNNERFGSVHIVMNDDDPWFFAPSGCKSLPTEANTPWHGYVYALEYGDGIKIGHTINLAQRIASLKRNAEKYSDISIGSVLFTQAHTNHKENETLLHKHFHCYRKTGSERFNVTLDYFFDNLPEMDFLDESKQKEQRGSAFIQALINYVKGGDFLE